MSDAEHVAVSTRFAPVAHALYDVLAHLRPSGSGGAGTGVPGDLFQRLAVSVH